MKRIFLPALLALLTVVDMAAQSTLQRIYDNVFAAQCNNAGCHNSIDAAGGLDLEGTGFNPAAEVRANLYQATPNNATAQAKNNQLVRPGDPYRSFLFRLVNNGLAGDVSVGAAEDPSGIHEAVQIPDIEKEMIRQWIIFDAPESGQAVSHQRLEKFYAGDGIWAIDPQNPPPPPPAGEGFQIHVGPLFIDAWESGEQPNMEFYSKYETLLPAIEVNRIDAQIGSSHHLLLYKFDDQAAADANPFGYRTNANHNGINMVSAFGESQDLHLPGGTAFKWDQNAVLDLNTHIINYSNIAVMASDAYVNVYTQPQGTAAQEMVMQLIPNPALYIPNNGEEVEVEVPFSLDFPATIHVWMVSSHTHKYGVGFDVWLRNPDGSRGEQIYDGTRWNGIPECEDLGYYDYQHPPTRYFSPFLPVNVQNGIIHRARYINDGPTPVTWGGTSNDEMMITGVGFTFGNAGVTPGEASGCATPTSTYEGVSVPSSSVGLKAGVSPNPVAEEAVFAVSSPRAAVAQLRLYDVTGREVFRMDGLQLQRNANNTFGFQRGGLPGGIYVYTITDERGNNATGKLVLD